MEDDGGLDTCINSSSVHGGKKDMIVCSAEHVYHSGVSFTSGSRINGCSARGSQ